MLEKDMREERSSSPSEPATYMHGPSEGARKDRR
jgi:hypothetical protein